MAEIFPSITPEIRDFIEAQKMFFVATAPHEGRINLSPRGMDTFRVLDDNTVAYLDLTGSGNETAAHLIDDGRITFMFCSFTRNPRIIRLYGRGAAVYPGTPEFDGLAAGFPGLPGVRQIIQVNVSTAMTSCGYGVPVYDLSHERDTLERFFDKMGPDEIAAYQREHNLTSIDGSETGLRVD